MWRRCVRASTPAGWPVRRSATVQGGSALQLQSGPDSDPALLWDWAAHPFIVPQREGEAP